MSAEDEEVSGRWKVIEFTLVVLLIGFALGYWCAIKVEKARIKRLSEEEISVEKITVGTQSTELKKRTVGAQSQCTYKRKIVSPRFQVLPQVAGGVFCEDEEIHLSDL